MVTVDERSIKDNGKVAARSVAEAPLAPKRTRGFIRAQQKRARLLELVPEDALIVAMDLARDEHAVWMTTTKKEPLDRLKVTNNPAGMEQVLARAEAVRQAYGLGKIVFAMEPTIDRKLDFP